MSPRCIQPFLSPRWECMARLQAFHLRLEPRLCPGLHLGQLGRAGVRHKGGVHKDALVLVAWTVRRCCEATLYIICCHLSSPATAWAEGRQYSVAFMMTP